ncbi:AAA family ATPase [Radiobacillus sp. PE A8.2]|uniref:AAA family ATPase n=1 Tax=Radiobacillus sp. PE A8.2 TaxID=3380349 RepID=UPI00388E8F6B
MRILSAHIYGFGKLQNYEMNFQVDSIVVFAGDNESGKSTLRQFLLFMLFGLAPKQREAFRPKTGGEIGGKVTLSTEKDGDFVVERLHDRNNGQAVCFLPNGESKDESWLKDRLFGMTRETFQSIFSFDSNDLSYLHSLHASELGDVLLNIGMTGMDKIATIERKLDNELSQRFRPQGKKPEINDQLHRVDQLYRKLLTMEQEEVSYRDKKVTLQTVSDELERYKNEVDTLQKQKIQVEKEIQTNPLMVEAYNQSKQFEKLQIGHKFPEDGLLRYQTLKDKLLPLKSEEALVLDNLKKYQSELHAVYDQIVSEEENKEIQTLLEQQAAYQQQQQSHQAQQREVRAIKGEIVAEIEKLQIGLRLQDLEHISFPFHIEDTWNQIRIEKDQWNGEVEKIDQELMEVKQDFRELEDQKRVCRSQMMDEHTYYELEAKLAQAREADNDRLRNQLQLDQRTEWNARRVKQLKLSSVILMISCLFGIGLAIYGVMIDNYSLLMLGTLLAVVGIVQRFWTTHTHRLMREYLSDTNNQSTDIHIDADERLNSERAIEVQKKLRDQLASLQSKGKDLQAKLLKLEERRNFLLEKQEQLQRKVNEQKRIYPFLESVAIEYWPTLYHRLSNALDKLKKYNQIIAEMTELEFSINNYEIQLQAFLVKRNREGVSIDIPYLHELADQQLKLKSTSEQYQQWIVQSEEHRRQLAKKMLPYQQEIEKLWKIAAVENEEDFLKKGNQNKELDLVSEKYKSTSDQVKNILPEAAIGEIPMMQPRDGWELEQQLNGITELIDDITQRIEVRREQKANIRAELGKMESSEDYSILRHRLQIEKDQLRQQVKDWAIYQVAKGLLVETKQQFQQKYLPRVLEQTTHYFRILTNENYRFVFPPQEGESLLVEHATGTRFEVKELSQGTSDQLYVALRLALSEISSATHAMPFFIDDAFVHFDEKRAKIMLDILSSIARKQQIILFTCQPFIKEYVNRMEASVVEKI